MADARDAEGILRQNLVDAGCDDELVRRCMALCRERESPALQRRLLLKHRDALLDRLHDAQEQIDCLDYLLHKLEKISTKEDHL